MNLRLQTYRQHKIPQQKPNAFFFMETKGPTSICEPIHNILNELAFPKWYAISICSDEPSE